MALADRVACGACLWRGTEGELIVEHGDREVGEARYHCPKCGSAEDVDDEDIVFYDEPAADPPDHK